MNYIPYKLAGIPCQIEVTHSAKQNPHKGSPQTCWSDEDYHGFEEFEYRVRDRKGYLAPWLEKKITPATETDILETISRHFKEERNSYEY